MRLHGGTTRTQRSLNYEDRVWEAKSDALRRLISACRSVKRKAQYAQQPDCEKPITKLRPTDELLIVNAQSLPPGAQPESPEQP